MGQFLPLRNFLLDSEIVLFGRKNEILSELKRQNTSEDKFQIIDCTDIISMGEHPTKAFKSKPNSSIAKGFS